MSVKRYAPSMRVGSMRADVDGLWIKLSDYDAALARETELLAKVESLEVSYQAVHEVVSRVTAERNALQLLLNTADQRNADLQSDLTKAREEVARAVVVEPDRVAVLAELAKARENSKRYLWLRDHNIFAHVALELADGSSPYFYGEALDDALDQILDQSAPAAKECGACPGCTDECRVDRESPPAAKGDL